MVAVSRDSKVAFATGTRERRDATRRESLVVYKIESGTSNSGTAYPLSKEERNVRA